MMSKQISFGNQSGKKKFVEFHLGIMMLKSMLKEHRNVNWLKENYKESIITSKWNQRVTIILSDNSVVYILFAI